MEKIRDKIKIMISLTVNINIYNLLLYSNIYIILKAKINLKHNVLLL